MSGGLAPSLAASLDRLSHRLAELDAALADGTVASDAKRYRALSQEHAEVGRVVSMARQHRQRQDDRDTARQMLDDAQGDAELKAMAQEEVAEAEADIAAARRLLASLGG